MKSHPAKFKSFQHKIVHMGALQKLQNSIQISGATRGRAKGVGSPLFWVIKDEMTEGKGPAGQENQNRPPPPLSSRSGSDTANPYNFVACLPNRYKLYFKVIFEGLSFCHFPPLNTSILGKDWRQPYSLPDLSRFCNCLFWMIAKQIRKIMTKQKLCKAIIQ